MPLAQTPVLPVGGLWSRDLDVFPHGGAAHHNLDEMTLADHQSADDSSLPYLPSRGFLSAGCICTVTCIFRIENGNLSPSPFSVGASKEKPKAKTK